MIVRGIGAKAVFSAEKMSKVSLLSGSNLYAGLNCFEPGQEHKAHVHHDQDKMYLILEGTGEVTVGDGPAELVSPGDLVLANAGVLHSLKNSSHQRLIVLVLFSPPPAK